jgi:hypothetical protein
MEDLVISPKTSNEYYNPRFLEFLELFVSADTHEKLFPKDCRTCGKTFQSLSHYLDSTVGKGHTLDDAEEVMGMPYTMTYRHCTCGNTLVLTFTAETYPMLGRLWTMLRAEAKVSKRPLNDVISEFVEQWERYMTTHMKSLAKK